MKKQLTSDADVEFLEKADQIEEVEAAHAVYERFKLEWMLDHGYTLKDLIEELEKQREECPDLTLDSTFRDWEFGFGFGSDIWPCFWEYYHSEYEPKKEELAVMDRHDTELLSGRYVAENREGTFSAYRIVMDVKETEKSYIMQLVAFKSRYSASHISHLFSKSKRVVLNKARGGHAIRKWGDGTFTFYPFQAGIPFYFERSPENADEGNEVTESPSQSQPAAADTVPSGDFEECESRDCAYNRDGTCRFSLVFDRQPKIIEEDGCTEFVTRSSYSMME